MGYYSYHSAGCGAVNALGIGIIGTGQRCMNFYGPFIKSHPSDSTLVALADTDPHRVASACHDLGGDARTYSSLEPMLQDPRVDVVIITTPDHTHRKMLEATLKAGKHVICEKPLATTIEDAQVLLNLASESDRVVQLGFILRYSSFSMKLKEVVDSGAIGPLVQVSGSEVVEYYHGASFFRRWHRHRAESGGLLIHKACHTLDIINWLANGRPIWVSASGGIDTFVPREGAANRCRDCSLTEECPAAYRVDAHNWIYQPREERDDPWASAKDLCVYDSAKDSVDNAVMLIGYDTGVTASFSFATTGARQERQYLLVGQKWHIFASQAEGTILVHQLGRTSQEIVVPKEQRNEHGGSDNPLMESFFRCVRLGERPLADIEAGVRSVMVGVGATQSIDRDGCRVDLR